MVHRTPIAVYVNSPTAYPNFYPHPPNHEAEAWNKEQVGEWLDNRELGDVKELFNRLNRHSVDALDMMHFAQQDLERMGVSMGKAMRFVVARSQL